MKKNIPQISTTLTWNDILNNWKVRWDIGRMNYRVKPGLYQIGRPHKASQVLVTANYKLSLDALRKELKGFDVWLLILDTKGVNVWCAAGKGTFGTKELVSRIKKVNLADYVSQHTIILPQLGAPGISAHLVKKQTGFSVVYGPVRAEDLPYFIKSGFKKTKQMSAVTFSFKERLTVVPVELMQTKSLILGLVIWAVIVNLLKIHSFTFSPVMVKDAIALVGAVLTGSVFTPLLLPWLPSRSFALKGFWLGLLWAFLINKIFMFSGLKITAYYFILPMISAFLSLNFTGASTYTSPSGTLLEVKRSVPIIIFFIGIGVLLTLLYIFK